MMCRKVQFTICGELHFLYIDNKQTDILKMKIKSK